MSTFPPVADLVEARAQLKLTVDEIVRKLRQGVLPGALERERIDLKEEAGRRGAGGLLLPGSAHNLAAADHLANEVACLANTPGGGALLIGVENATGALLGAALDEEWLRHRIYERIDLAPAVEPLMVDGVRLLIAYVAQAREPVEGTDGKLRWRIGGHCEPVDRGEWWLHRQSSTGHDEMAKVSTRTFADVAPGSLQVARRRLREEARPEDADLILADDTELLTRLGVLRPDGRLTQAGALMFCSADTTYLELSIWDVEGGDVLLHPPDLSGLSLIEQIAEVEARLDTVNTAVTLRSGFTEFGVRRLPPPAVREAVLNAVAHRDWLQPDPVTLTFVQEDSALQVVSPGGFVGGVVAGNVLTQRYARYPALADLLRALRLVEKQGLGVDRMYQEMIALGHRPPVIVEHPGPRVRTRLAGGAPVVPVMNLLGAIRPQVRRRDVRIALIVYTLLHEPFVIPKQLAPILQRTTAEAANALLAASECRVGDQPLLTHFKDVWILSPASLALIDTVQDRAALARRGVLTYRRPESAEHVARRWLQVHERFTTGDHAVLTGLAKSGALRQLERLNDEGLLRRGPEMGRNAHFVAGPGLNLSRRQDQMETA